MPNKMGKWIIILMNFLWIHTGDALGGKNVIGTLSVEEPVIVGSNVTFTFRPANYTEPHTLQLQYDDGDGQEYKNVYFERLYNDANNRSLGFYIPNAEETLNGKNIYIKYNEDLGPGVAIKMFFPPELGPLRDVDGCTNCIVAHVGEPPSFQCLSNVTVGKIKLVQLKVGDKKNCTVIIDQSGMHVELQNKQSCKLSNSEHRSLLTCVVHVLDSEVYSLNSDPRALYIPAQPGQLEIETSDPLEEGDQGHLTCRSKGGRPPPQLEMLIDGSVLPSTALQVIDSDHVIRLSPVERDWHGKTLTCRYWNEFYNDTATKLLNINYRPTTNNIIIYIIVPLVLCLVLAVCITLVVFMKRRRARDKAFTYKISATLRTTAEDKNGARSDRVVVTHTTKDDRNAAADQCRTSDATPGHIEECTYSDVIKPVKSKQSEPGSQRVGLTGIESPSEKTAEEGTDATFFVVNNPMVATCSDQLIYADLDKVALNRKPQRKSETTTATVTAVSEDVVEYVGIDFNKTVANQEYRDEESADGENVYHNQ